MERRLKIIHTLFRNIKKYKEKAEGQININIVKFDKKYFNRRKKQRRLNALYNLMECFIRISCAEKDQFYEIINKNNLNKLILIYKLLHHQ
jgi:hypothetical protein